MMMITLCALSSFLSFQQPAENFTNELLYYYYYDDDDDDDYYYYYNELGKVWGEDSLVAIVKIVKGTPGRYKMGREYDKMCSTKEVQ